eukprot:TRINITY_DN6213_c0_g2_i2.p1 TRINITY_DN6213_c0_g2~~TRINITY_DN6213_c0_g2_i2.p1  ORF type:complete len:331 (+),score=18.31 TRINITY_DN6213_c0_g2_i2:466-1458(+)
MLRGYKRVPKSLNGASLLDVSDVETSCAALNQSCLESRSSCCSNFVCGREGVCLTAKEPDQVDWTHLQTASKVMNQGGCGSCWAVTAAGVLSLQAEIASQGKFVKAISPQSILECTPNQYECGGAGGCQGATVELAFAWLASSSSGVTTLEHDPYLASTKGCAFSSSFLESTRSSVTIKGFRKLKENTAKDMMVALATIGPLGASIAAEKLTAYSSGVITNCKEWTIDHAVVIMGYGHDAAAGSNGVNYWKLRNSWGADYGENGFFRIGRAGKDEEEPCDIDEDPSKGTACRDKIGGAYPLKQKVCGECGVLADTAYPLSLDFPASLNSA